MDFYATSPGGSVPCRVTPFPDLDKTSKFKRACTPCQGFLMYMNIVSITKVDGSIDNKLCEWSLKSEGWQLMSEISADIILTGGFDFLPVTINTFDAKTAYFWSKKGQRLVSINLHNGEFMIHNNQLDGRSDGPIMIPVKDPRAIISLKSRNNMEYINGIPYHLLLFLLPQWLYRIPVSIKHPTTTTAKTKTVGDKGKVIVVYEPEESDDQSPQNPNANTQHESKDIPFRYIAGTDGASAIELSNPFVALGYTSDS
ncbi:unnamed protein product [Eruca vesicaria subsp. sativa]|uniref:F-box protein At3g26010-like beta-propeller domain-containing protein n=1 Tax=Eruca vesicaria subsp. sativa TaxID=29727 RepID=A0ABC8KZZ0_ERUVS|nr:unnamed protein product [Eruca vesicaria subsp. sativa]